MPKLLDIMLCFACFKFHRWQSLFSEFHFALILVVMTFHLQISYDDLTVRTVIFMNYTLRYVMYGPSMTQSSTHQELSNEETVDSLRSDLLSGDEFRARSAAAFIRSSYDIRSQYRAAGLGLAIVIDGELQSVHPDSPLIPDLSSLIPLVRELFPLPPDKEPPGFC